MKIVEKVRWRSSNELELKMKKTERNKRKLGRKQLMIIMNGELENCYSVKCYEITKNC